LKTQVIATLTNYAYKQGKSVLLVTPGKKARDELVKRCKNAFGLDVPSADGKIDCMITSGLINRTDYKDENLRKQLVNKIAQYQWILVDEVEYTINDSGKFLFDSATGFENMYAFSGTSSKKDGKCINFMNGLDDEVILNNMDLIKYFGPSLVFRLPLNIDIKNISVTTKAFWQVNIDEIPEEDKEANIYLAVMNKIFTTPAVCELIVKIAKRYPKLYIPLNFLNNIIDFWIENYFIGQFRILLICGEGYIYYDLDGNKRKLADLQEAWNMVKNNEVDIIPSTSSGYRALDLPDLQSILAIANNVAGAFIQSVGRTARGTEMNVITMIPHGKRKIPVYSKGVAHRDELLKDYYKYCNIQDITINEEDL